MTIESILTEWRYRLKKGYPDTSADYDILANILVEQGIEQSEADRIAQQAQGNDIPDENPTGNRFSELNLPQPVVDQIEQTYNGLSPQEKLEFDKNYRTHSIQSFVESGYKAFEKFFLVNVGGARGGMGNGEISVLLGVAESKPGGTAQHDIVMPTGEWEVKELKSGKFDPAAEGLVSKFALTQKIQSFYKEIVLPVNDIGDPYEQLKHLVDHKSHDQLKRLLMIFETRFSEAIDPDKLQSYEWKKSAMYNWYEGFKELNNIFYNTKLDTSVRDTRITVDTDGNKESYWIDDDDANSIRQKAGSDDTADIWVGDPVSDQNSDIIIWFKRVERNEFIREPSNFISELNHIKSTFFQNIAGLIWYDYRNPVPHIGLPDNFAIDVASQGRYRFVVKNVAANNGYPYIEQQS